MASNAVLQDQRFRPSDTVSRAQSALDQTRFLRRRVATSAELGQTIDLGLRAGVSVRFKPDKRNDMPESFVQLVERIKEFELCPADWDSYGALPLSDDAVLPTIQLAIVGIHRCEAPDVVLRANGGLGLRWYNGARELEIDVNPDGKCTAFFTSPEGDVEIDDPCDADEVEQLVIKVCQMA